jgi:hypothetical protein
MDRCRPPLRRRQGRARLCARVVAIGFAAIFAPSVAPDDPTKGSIQALDADRYAGYLLGTDDFDATCSRG